MSLGNGSQLFYNGINKQFDDTLLPNYKVTSTEFGTGQVSMFSTKVGGNRGGRSHKKRNTRKRLGSTSSLVNTGGKKRRHKSRKMRK